MKWLGWIIALVLFSIVVPSINLGFLTAMWIGLPVWGWIIIGVLLAFTILALKMFMAASALNDVFLAFLQAFTKR